MCEFNKKGEEMLTERELNCFAYELLGSNEQLTKEQEYEIFKIYKSYPSQELRNAICEKNAGLVGMVARGYSAIEGIEYEDVFQEGVIGLIKSIDRFDEERGVKFSTYAVDWIRREIRNFIKDNRHVRFPSDVQTSIHKIVAAENKYKSTFGECTNKEELIDYIVKNTDVSRKTVRWYYTDAYMFNVVSLNSQVSTDDEHELIDLIDDPGNPYEEIETGSDMERLRNILSIILPKRNYEILAMRYGFNGHKPCTNAACAEKFNIGEGRVKSIISESLARIRKEARAYGIMEFANYLDEPGKVKGEKIC
jgi:RNA polymerase primary sigma factor